jgi:hypothetical protein
LLNSLVGNQPLINAWSGLAIKCSRKIAVTSFEGMGKGLEALEDIPAGEEIVEVGDFIQG